MEDTRAGHFIKRLSSLRGERATWEYHWQELADYMVPNKANINTESTPGEKKNTHLYDNTAIHSSELLAGSLHGILTNPNTTWFELTTGDAEVDKGDNVRNWLQDSVHRMHRILNNTNFQTEIHEFYMNLVVFGTSAMLLEEDKKNIVRFSSRPIEECFVQENNKGIIDELYRCFSWDAKKILQEWPKADLPEELIRAFQDNPAKKYKIIHALAPRESVEQLGIKVPSTKKTVSVYILEEKQLILEESGFNEFPYLVSRWSKVSGETYGRSPGMTALPEAKTINKIVEVNLIAAEKAIDPPLQLPDDGFIMPIITQPGGLNFYRAGSNERIEPVFNNSRLDIGIEIIKQHQAKIREALHVDLFQLREGPQKTATEVLQLTEEQSRVLSPLLGRQHHEFLRPLIERVFSIMTRRNMFRETPEELAGLPLDVRYSSLIARSHKVEEGQNIMRTIQMMEPFIALDETVADNFDGDKALRKVAEIYNFPQEIIRTVDEVEEVREARAQAQEQALQAQQQQQQAENANKLAPVAAAVGSDE
jgi:hypothetical protein